MKTLIANSGIQMFTFPIEININENAHRMFFREWFEPDEELLKLEIAHLLASEEEKIFVSKNDLAVEGYISDPNIDMNEVTYQNLREDGIKALKKGDDDRMCEGVRGKIYPMSFRDRNNKISALENVWLPLPFFKKKGEKSSFFGPLNWSRFKLIPKGTDMPNCKCYDVILAFDTRARYQEDDNYKETPIFADDFDKEIEFSVCKSDLFLIDYCSADKQSSYVNEYIRQLVHPGLKLTKDIKGEFKYSYIASYIHLVNYISAENIFPEITLYRDEGQEYENIDMIVDIGNSRATAVLVEDNNNFNQIRSLELQDYTDLLVTQKGSQSPTLNIYNDPFDMRVAFRKADFGKIAIRDSLQFVHPSLVRLGVEANKLIHKTAQHNRGKESVSTCSSPKRYLWDEKPNKVDWEFITLSGEDISDSILNLPGITDQLNIDGTIDPNRFGGMSFSYSRRSLMTFSFLEMLTQANVQINSHEYRTHRGAETKPRRIKRLIVTCPTTMSQKERSALIRSAKDAITLSEKFDQKRSDAENKTVASIAVVPSSTQRTFMLDDEKHEWYYDEATSAQFVYVFAEISQRYGCHCDEFFRLHGKKREDETKESLIIGSLDIGAGTSDLIINKYDYTDDTIVSVSPTPLFYDSFYFAGDDMLKKLVLNLIVEGDNSALKKRLSDLSNNDYSNLVRKFFGPNYNEQSFEERILRRDFNIQVSVPLMHYFLDLLSKEEKYRLVKYEDVFSDNTLKPNARVLQYFEDHFGFDFATLEWEYNYEEINTLVTNIFEPLLKKIATIMYAHSCDIVILSGRPSSLPPIEQIFLKYYAVSPNRLILLNKYHIGDWYPFNSNGGYISDSKTVVCTGAMIGHYASELANFKGFRLKLDKLGAGLKSTVNYLINPNQTSDSEALYFITPETNTGTVSLATLPISIEVRQLDLDSYHPRALFSIDYNHSKLAQSIIDRALEDNIELTAIAVQEKVDERILQIKRNMPLEFIIEREPEEEGKEDLIISSVQNRNDDSLSTSFFEISVQSLGTEENYWLDTGIIF